jgi:hypothetical protein
MAKFFFYILIFVDLTIFFARNLALWNVNLDSIQAQNLFRFNLICLAALAALLLAAIARFLFQHEKNITDRWPLTPPE